LYKNSAKGPEMLQFLNIVLQKDRSKMVPEIVPFSSY